jgi:hypothetical protein
MIYFPEHKFAVAVQVNTSAPRATGKPLSRFIGDLAAIIANQTNVNSTIK